MKKLIALSALAALVAGGNVMAGDAAAGQTKSATCAGCHGPDGNSFNPVWPSLAGQNVKYIVKQLAELKAGSRTDPTMSPMAAPLSDEDMADLAAYFSSQAIKGGEADPKLVKQGELIYRGGNMETGVPACMACHGPDGKGNEPAGFPAVAGQQAPYSAKQLHAFQDGTRTNDPNKMMQGVVRFMSKAEIEAVASYMQGLH